MFSRPCSYCGKTAGVSPPSPPASINSIMEQTQLLDEAISALYARRAKLLRQLNELQPPTTKLPPEILSQIFSHACPPFNFRTSGFVPQKNETEVTVHRQIALSAVSSHWRQVIYSTPRLWATALMYVKRETVGSKADLLEMYLKNVRGVPFSLGLHLRDVDGQRASDFEPIFRAIQKRSQAFNLLSLSGPPQVWFPTLSPYLPNLEELRLRWAWGDPGTRGHVLQISHLSSATLHRVLICGSTIGWAPSDQPCYNITVLHLASLPRHTYVQLLRLCPNLIECRYERANLGSDVASLDGLDHVTSHSLRLFQVLDLSFNDVLPLLHFPQLQTFSFALGDPELEMAGLLAFIGRLPRTCSTLEIQGRLTEITIRQAARAVPPHVQTLQLPYLAGRDIPGTLTHALWYSPDGRSFNMPGLRRICMGVCWEMIFPCYTTWGQKLFPDLLSARKDLLDGRFILEIGGSSSDVDLAPFKNRLRALASEGLQLDILVSGARIPGLSEIYEGLGTSS